MIGAVENKTFADEQAFSEIKRLSTAGLEGPELVRRAAEALKRAVPFGSYCVATLDPETSLLTHVYNGGSAGEDGHKHLRSIFEKAGVNCRREMVQRIYFENLLPDVLRG